MDPDTPGRVEGRVLDHAFEPVADAMVAVFHDGEFLTQTTSDGEGRFKVKDLTPGGYAVRVQGECCREKVVRAEVEPGGSVALDVVLEALRAADVKTPHVKEHVWEGFVACSSRSAILATSGLCFDANHDVRHDFIVEGGVRSVTVALEWDDSQLAQSEEYQIQMENLDVPEECPDLSTASSCPYRYAFVAGESPLMFVVNESVDEPEARWDALESGKEWTLQFNVLPRDDVAVVYQQPFTVHYHVHYWQEAPEDYDPLKEGSE